MLQIDQTTANSFGKIDCFNKNNSMKSNSAPSLSQPASGPARAINFSIFSAFSSTNPAFNLIARTHTLHKEENEVSALLIGHTFSYTYRLMIAIIKSSILSVLNFSFLIIQKNFPNCLLLQKFVTKFNNNQLN